MLGTQEVPYAAKENLYYFHRIINHKAHRSNKELLVQVDQS
jgi:hypothetical protein